MKKKIAFLLSLLILVGFVGCQSRSQSLDLAICGSYGVPGMFCTDLKGEASTCNVLETDAQGRILFEFTNLSVITGKEETAIVICQKYDSEHVYFYEDQCYILGAVEESAIADLKEQNDWGCALDEKKMAKRSNQLSLDLYIVTDSKLDYQKVQAACCEALEIDKAEIRELCFLDQDPTGQTMYWLSAETADYYIIVNTEYEAAFIAAENPQPDAEAIADFKQNNGWKYSSP
ncbi:MAG: hypothetical protein IJX69_04285 [Oscillospiraceae bacterium]|nr:hypothetical protein [Oscillospiraceae bacterium]